MRVKCWPLERYIEVARWHAGTGGVPVFFVGPNEQEWIEEIRTAVPEALLPLQRDDIWTEGFSPLTTVALGRRLTAALVNDSGAGHMMAAADIPLLTLFGPTDVEKFRPVATRGEVLTAQTFGGDAMTAIPAEAVVERLSKILG